MHGIVILLVRWPCQQAVNKTVLVLCPFSCVFIAVSFYFFFEDKVKIRKTPADGCRRNLIAGGVEIGLRPPRIGVALELRGLMVSLR